MFEMFINYSTLIVMEMEQ